MDLDFGIILLSVLMGLLFMGALPLIITGDTFEWVSNHKKQCSPLTEDLLRLPGKFTQEKLSDVRKELFVNLAISMFTPMITFIMCGLIFVRGYMLDEMSLSITTIINTVVGMSLIMGYFVFKDITLLRKRRELNLQLDCEIAVSQELNQLMREGYYIYHSFPAKDFNIDHIVIGPLGVFAIETLARNKTLTNDNRKQANVIYDGESLKFPTWTETQPLEQIKAHAEWLANWLKEVEGVSIRITPVLTLPGWFVKSEKKHAIRVYNPSHLLRKIKENSDIVKLTPEEMKRIAGQVEARCRETEELK